MARIRDAAGCVAKEDRTLVPITLAEHGSVFVIFRKEAGKPSGSDQQAEASEQLTECKGPWKVRFDPRWGGPAEADFPELVSWTDRPEPGIRYYSGTASYVTTLKLPAGLKGELTLDLGDVREIAEVYLNGKSYGVIWAKPYKAWIPAKDLKETNELKIEVVNFWPNRLIGDQQLPPQQRLTRTNIRAFKKDSPLTPSGLIGPVRLLGTKATDAE
jgi:hypothetical protein